MTQEEKELIREQENAGKVVLSSFGNLFSVNTEDLCSQPVDGLLYDLNRDEATTYVLNNERAINDIAVAKVIRYLHKKAFGK